MPQFIFQQVAERQVVERLLSVFNTHFDATLTAMWNRTTDNFTGTDAGYLYTFFPDIYLPTPTKSYRQVGPTTGQQQDVGEPVLFVGPVGEAVPTSKPGNAGEFGTVWQVVQPFACTVVFGRSGNQPVTDNVQGRLLREEEHVRERAIYYLGALVEIVTARAPAGDFPEIHAVNPLGRQAAQVEMELNSGQYPAFGIASFSFQVVNFQAFPNRIYGGQPQGGEYSSEYSSEYA